MENNAVTDTVKSETAPSGGIEKHQLIVFRLGSEEYGIHIDQIKEVVLTPRITRMPHTPAYVKGVANIRGSILAIVDLEEKFGLQNAADKTEEDTSNYTLVAESKDFSVGILVKEVPNTLSVMTSDIDETVNVVQDAAENSNYMLGIAKIDDRLIILIDLFKIMQTNDLSGVFQETSVSA